MPNQSIFNPKTSTVSVKEFAIATGLTEHYVRELVELDSIKHMHAGEKGRKIRILVSEIIDFPERAARLPHPCREVKSTPSMEAPV